MSFEVEWVYEVPTGSSPFGQLPTNPVVSVDTVYVGDLSTRVHAIDRATGEERFVVGDGAAIVGPPRHPRQPDGGHRRGHRRDPVGRGARR